MSFPQVARYPSLGPSLWAFDHLPSGVQITPTPLVASDHGESHGTLFHRGSERIVAMFMHPRGDMQRHYAMPTLLESGIACWGHAGRFVNNDIACIKERLLLDVAAGVSHLRDKGFDKIIFVGNSGGGALYSFYQGQAQTPVPGRLTQTAAGDPLDFNAIDLPAADGLVQLATHLGEGRLMQAIIDPSVVDEHDPLSIDPSLDMYNPANGFCGFQKSSSYSDAFLTRYREAQERRIARIDAISRALVAESRYHMKKIGADSFDALSIAEQNWFLRRGFVGRYMEIHRTEANPAYADLSINPNKRAIGSFFSPRPDILNYTEAGFGKYQTPRAWLSTWSSLSSPASTLDQIGTITVPTLVIAFDADNAVMPCDTDAIFEASPAQDKEKMTVSGDHLGYGPTGMDDRSGQNAAATAISAWIHERF